MNRQGTRHVAAYVLSDFFVDFLTTPPDCIAVLHISEVCLVALRGGQEKEEEEEKERRRRRRGGG